MRTLNMLSSKGMTFIEEGGTAIAVMMAGSVAEDEAKAGQIAVACNAYGRLVEQADKHESELEHLRGAYRALDDEKSSLMLERDSLVARLQQPASTAPTWGTSTEPAGDGFQRCAKLPTVSDLMDRVRDVLEGLEDMPLSGAMPVRVAKLRQVVADMETVEALKPTAPTLAVTSVQQEAPSVARHEALEAAEQACKEEYVEDTGTDGDTAYNNAVDHCVAAIRRIKETP